MPSLLRSFVAIERVSVVPDVVYVKTVESIATSLPVVTS